MRTQVAITKRSDPPINFDSFSLDEETELYYYGARYMEPRISRWVSTVSAVFPVDALLMMLEVVKTSRMHGIRR